MSGFPSRRSSTAPPPPNIPVPAAPPLPAPRPLQRARNAFGGLFGYTSRPASPPSGASEPRPFLPGGLGRRPTHGATENATASHKTGLEINSIAINGVGTHALLGGKEIFKTIRIEGGVCAEELNLRSAIRSTPTHASGRPRQIYSIDIADVAWAKGQWSNYVAAATSSGKIVLYDVGHAAIQAAQLHEHFRQVHKVTFNPHRGSLLLSGSQDGTERLWDVRDVKEAQSTHALPSKRKFSGQSDGVRDVKWSPTDGTDFAFGTDSGWIQRWDIRNLSQPKSKIPAHSLAINAVDWHADGVHIMSASLDRTVKVWDVSSGKRQQRATWEVKTPYAVYNARWRPACDNGENRYCTQLATSYDSDHPVMHIWDLRRPSIPFRELAPHHKAPTDFLWHSQDLLWSVGKDGAFLQNDTQHAPKIMERRNLVAMSLSALGELTFITQKRKQKRRPNSHGREDNNIAASSENDSTTRSKHISFSQQSSSTGSKPDSLPLSRSWADDSLDHDFLASTPPLKQPRKSSNSAPSKFPKSRTQSLSMQSYPEKDKNTVEPLDVTMNAAGRTHRPKQQMWTGTCPLLMPPKTVRFLAQNYKIDLAETKEQDDFIGAYEGVLKHSEHVAAAAGYLRLAQEWKILSMSVINHLNKRVNSIPEEDRPQNARSWEAVRASMQIDVEEGCVFQMVMMVKKIVDFYIQAEPGSSSNVPMTACTIMLLLSPVLPQTHPLPSAESDATVDIFLSTYEELGFSKGEREKIFNNVLQPLLRAGLQPLKVESLISTYHEQLVRHQLFAEAAALRKLAYPAFPVVYEDWIVGNSVFLACGSCGTEMLQPAREKRKCNGCATSVAKCAVCWMYSSPFETGKGGDSAGKTMLWSACLKCGHSAHDACLREIWQDPEIVGKCPTMGCGCDCGGDTAVGDVETRAKVKKDEWTAGTSRAVDEAVGALSLRDQQ